MLLVSVKLRNSEIRRLARVRLPKNTQRVDKIALFGEIKAIRLNIVI